jgi:hypothetical protein
MNNIHPIFAQALKPFAPPPVDYEARVQALEAEGLTRSDAQGVVDAEDLMKGHACGTP